MQSLLQSLTRGAAVVVVASACLASSQSAASAEDQAFFNSVAGSWKGPGEIVAGKYKGTKFVCDLTGDPLQGGATGIRMEGTCRVGIFSQDMSAVISRVDGQYTGQFLDGAQGKGLDVISGEVRANKIAIGINRKQLNGAMVASLHDANRMNVTVSVEVGERLIPVIGMTLDRDLDGMQVGSIR